MWRLLRRIDWRVDPIPGPIPGLIPGGILKGFRHPAILDDRIKPLLQF